MAGILTEIQTDNWEENRTAGRSHLSLTGGTPHQEERAARLSDSSLSNIVPITHHMPTMLSQHDVGGGCWLSALSPFALLSSSSLLRAACVLSMLLMINIDRTSFRNTH